MRPISLTYTPTNTGAISGTTITGGTPVPLNFNNVSVGIGFACVVTGVVSYTVYHCYDDLSVPNIVPTWLPHGVSNMVNATTTQESNFVIPVAAMQVIINSGSGSVSLLLLEQGII